MKNYILSDFKQNVIAQFIAVITFGFAITAFYSFIYIFINTTQINLNIKNISFIVLSFFGYLLSFYLVENKISLKLKIYKYIDFIINISGFVLMFVPIIILSEHLLDSISYDYMIIKNSLISILVFSLGDNLILSGVKFSPLINCSNVAALIGIGVIDFSSFDKKYIGRCIRPECHTKT